MADPIPTRASDTAEEARTRRPAEGTPGTADPSIDPATGLTPPAEEPAQPDGKEEKAKSVVGRQALESDIGGKLAESIEIKNPDNKIYFKLGKHDKGFRQGKTNDAVEDANTEALQKKTATHLYGWVDGTRFKTEKEVKHPPAWYNKKIESAKEIIKGKWLLDSKTQKWFDYVNEDGLLDNFAGMGNFTQRKWNALKKDHMEKIYAKDGLFNFLLAWERARRIHLILGDLDKDDFDPEKSLDLKKGSITLGFSNKVDDQDSRFAAKIEEEVTEEEHPEPPTDEEEPAEPEQPEEKPGATDGKATLLPDGKITLLPDGKTTIKPDGKYILKPDGKITLMPDGRNILPPDQTTPLPDGKTTIKPDGITTILTDGKTTILPDGKALLIPDKTVTILPDGKTTLLPDGTNVLQPDKTTLPDGKATILPNGQTSIIPDGKAVILPDGKANILPNGSTILTPNGTVTLNPQDGKMTLKLDGTATLKQEDKTIILRPDGSCSILPDGTTKLDTGNKVDGKYTINPDGTATLTPTSLDDKIYELLPDGNYKLRNDGQHVIKLNADGTYTLSQNGTATLAQAEVTPPKQDGKYTIAPDGSATLEPTDESKKTHYTLAPDGTYTLKTDTDKTIELKPDGTYKLTPLQDGKTTLQPAAQPTGGVTPGAGASPDVPPPTDGAVSPAPMTAPAAATVSDTTPAVATPAADATIAAPAATTGVAAATGSTTEAQPADADESQKIIFELPSTKTDKYAYKVDRKSDNYTVFTATAGKEEPKIIRMITGYLRKEGITYKLTQVDGDNYIKFTKGNKQISVDFNVNTGECEILDIGDNTNSLKDEYDISYSKDMKLLKFKKKEAK